MTSVRYARRKLVLQWLQLQHLKSYKQSERYKEQRAVFFLLLKQPSALFTDKKHDTTVNHLYKYTNMLNNYAKNEFLYKTAKEELSAHG